MNEVCWCTLPRISIRFPQGNICAVPREEAEIKGDGIMPLLASLLASLEKLLQHFLALAPTMGIISIEKNKLFHVGISFPA